MLQNAYLLAKIGADRAENEQHFAEILPTDALWRLWRADWSRSLKVKPAGGRRLDWLAFEDAVEEIAVSKSKMHFSKILQIFGGLVLGCIKTKFCKKICVRQHFSSSTRFASFCTAAISKFSQKIGLKKQQFSWNFSNKIANVAKFAKFCQISKISAR